MKNFSRCGKTLRKQKSRRIVCPEQKKDDLCGSVRKILLPLCQNLGKMLIPAPFWHKSFPPVLYPTNPLLSSVAGEFERRTPYKSLFSDLVGQICQFGQANPPKSLEKEGVLWYNIMRRPRKSREGCSIDGGVDSQTDFPLPADCRNRQASFQSNESERCGGYV